MDRARVIRLLLDDLRPQPLVDPPLDRRAAVVGLVNRAGQLDEPRAKVARPLARADVVLDPPERLVDRLQLRDQCRQSLAIEDRPVAGLDTKPPAPP